MTRKFSLVGITTGKYESSDIERIAFLGVRSVTLCMIHVADRRAHKCLAVSRPRPVLEPVTTIVCPVRSLVGAEEAWKIWPMFMLRISLKVAMVDVGNVYLRTMQGGELTGLMRSISIGHGVSAYVELSFPSQWHQVGFAKAALYNPQRPFVRKSTKWIRAWRMPCIDRHQLGYQSMRYALSLIHI